MRRVDIPAPTGHHQCMTATATRAPTAHTLHAGIWAETTGIDPSDDPTADGWHPYDVYGRPDGRSLAIWTRPAPGGGDVWLARVGHLGGWYGPWILPAGYPDVLDLIARWAGSVIADDVARRDP